MRVRHAERLGLDLSERIGAVLDTAIGEVQEMADTVGILRQGDCGEVHSIAELTIRPLRRLDRNPTGLARSPHRMAWSRGDQGNSQGQRTT
ncbi:hypothetical protein [Nocardia sp. NPDC004604]|uniref:hypothetical protein n=1 Tax=Nocardia sp. NPDC004604 TaxID=3157013 RepID=UPI0033BE04DF